MRNLISAAVLAAAFSAGVAQAATFSYSTDFSGGVGAEWAVSTGETAPVLGILGELGGGGASSATLTQVSSDSGSGTLAFDLLLFRTMDGVNEYTDEFTLKINGSTRYQAAFGTIAGGGADTVFINLDGASFTNTDLNDNASKIHITLGFAALTGVNTFQFSYPNLQSFTDERWGLDNVTFSARVGPVDTPVNPVPEPATWAMLIAGFGAAGAMIRRRRALPA